LPTRHSQRPADAGTRGFPSLSLPIALLLAVLIGMTVLSAGGCGSEQSEGDGSTVFAPQTVGGLTVTLRASPYPPAPMHEAEFSISITDGQGRPVEGAEVSCDMTMPAMPMPPNHPQAAEQSPGVYKAPVMFTMAGEWEALIEVLLADGTSGRFRFPMKTQ